jgi:hypothetical protein
MGDYGGPWVTHKKLGPDLTPFGTRKKPFSTMNFEIIYCTCESYDRDLNNLNNNHYNLTEDLSS